MDRKRTDARDPGGCVSPQKYSKAQQLRGKRRGKRPQVRLKRTKMRCKRPTPRRIAGIRNPALVGWIHTLPCARCGIGWAVEASHMPYSRRFGDENNVWPLCPWCHRDAPDSWHNKKRAWLAKHGGREGVAEISRQYTERFYREAA